jgi:hypothetical protein
MNNFKIYQLGASHNARFMADVLYILSLEMLSSLIDYVQMDMRRNLEKAAFVCAVAYGPWYLKSVKAQHAVMNDFRAFKSAFVLTFNNNLEAKKFIFEFSLGDRTGIHCTTR